MNHEMHTHLPLFLLFALLSPAIAKTLPYSDPDNKGGWTLNAAVSDEFDGESLDLDKWFVLGLDGNYYGEWKGRAPSQFSPANVRTSGGTLIITSKWEPDFKFSDTTCSNGLKYGVKAPITTGSIISKAKFKYGYMETRCKAADGPISSSFWTTGAGGEMDVFEHFGNSPKNPHAAFRYHTSFHDWRKGSPTFGKRIWTNDHRLDFRVADAFHIYGLEWDENFVKIFVDGRLVKCASKAEIGDKWVLANEQKIWIDSETFEWESNADTLKREDFGDGREFIVDYCRIWQRQGPGTIEAPRVNLITNPGFESGMESWTGTAAISQDGRSAPSSARMTRADAFEQTVIVKPSTTYIVSAWVKSTAANAAKVWLNCDLGVKGFGKDEITTKFILPGSYLERSIQFTTGPETTAAVIFFNNDTKSGPIAVDDVALVEAPSFAR